MCARPGWDWRSTQADQHTARAAIMVSIHVCPSNKTCCLECHSTIQRGELRITRPGEGGYIHGRCLHFSYAEAGRHKCRGCYANIAKGEKE